MARGDGCEPDAGWFDARSGHGELGGVDLGGSAARVGEDDVDRVGADPGGIDGERGVDGADARRARERPGQGVGGGNGRHEHPGDRKDRDAGDGLAAHPPQRAAGPSGELGEVTTVQPAERDHERCHGDLRDQESAVVGLPESAGRAELEQRGADPGHGDDADGNCCDGGPTFDGDGPPGGAHEDGEPAQPDASGGEVRHVERHGQEGRCGDRSVARERGDRDRCECPRERDRDDQTVTHEAHQQQDHHAGCELERIERSRP